MRRSRRQANNTLLHSVFLLGMVALILAGCSGSAKNTASHPVGHDEHSSPATHEVLASCLAKADVPMGAVRCELDLGAGTDTFWMDTDGVAPGVAGCHDEFVDATCAIVKSGRAFGELCLDSDRLVESNPGAGECHTHGGDLGHPDVVSCSAWCSSEGKVGGRCQDGIEAQGASGPCSSARCECDAA